MSVVYVCVYLFPSLLCVLCNTFSAASKDVQLATLIEEMRAMAKALTDTKRQLNEVKYAMLSSNSKREQLESEIRELKLRPEDNCKCTKPDFKSNTKGPEEKTYLEETKRLLTDQNTWHQLDLDVEGLKSTISAIQTKHDADIQSLNGKVTSIQNKDVRVGFTAVLSSDATNLGDNQIIRFDRVITNEGNSYNGNTGIFTCTVSGLYVFYTHILAEPGKHVDTRIMKNQSITVYTYSYDKEAYSSGSNMAVMNLNKGDTVMIITNGNQHSTSGAIIDSSYSTFSGFLVLAL